MNDQFFSELLRSDDESGWAVRPSPTTVLISRSGATSTGARSQLFPVKGTAARGRIRQQPEIAPQVAVRTVVCKNRRRFTPSSKTEFRERWIFEGLYTFILAEERSPRLASILDGYGQLGREIHNRKTVTLHRQSPGSIENASLLLC